MSNTASANAVRFTEYPDPDLLLVHFSDVHLLGTDDPLYGVADATGHLKRALAGLESSGAKPAALVFTGDIADTGDRDAYRRIRAVVGPVAHRLGATVLWLMGNHDDREVFRRELLGSQSVDRSPVDSVTTFDGLRVISLDTTVPGHHYGQIRPEQLTWLRNELATPAPRGSILALHHPPLPSIVEQAVTCELLDQQDLAAVVRSSDVRTILAGHIHHTSFGTFAGIPVSVATASSYTQDLTAPQHGMRTEDANQGYNLVHVYEDTILHSVVPIGHGLQMDFVSAEESGRRLAEQGIIRLARRTGASGFRA
ncbi:metallophosphoesterase [Curtobacterium sp. MCBD17_040]|uniref:metallophosphoesterase n=1 Tax=Curtobacterium sp. MCBD17_040 TaxID=2175674 RepID=UPI000DA969D6|nr:metallophosphoesterase [Curtobacterium sp. MCBD17_040]WIB65364.1 metallophosphoesterase [Curtobacterium sp. MCBD17_040]